jgi:3-oxoacyl-[acyl-carrier-protein] synthase II
MDEKQYLHEPGRRRVVVTGMGVVSPLGNDLDVTWDRLVAGESGIATITRFDVARVDPRMAAPIAGEVKDFRPEDYVDRRTARRMDFYSQYAVAAARQAVDEAGLDVAAEAEDVGAIVASGGGGLLTFEQQSRALFERGPRGVSPFFATMMIPNMAAAHVSLELGTKGPLGAVSTACSAGANAIGDAFEIIRRGAAVAMLAGGAEAPVNETGLAAFGAMRALSMRGDAPERASRPFDAGRDGFVIAEGAGILVLEELEHARARGARILAEIVGYGMSSEAFHVALPDQTGRPQARAMLGALREAGLAPEDVDYVNAHGTGTPAGDVAETRALKIAFGRRAPQVPVSSTKSMTGHPLGAAGAIEAAFCVRVIATGVVPPTINLTDPDPECDLDYVPNAARAIAVRTAMSNSFGFGGHDVSLVFRRFEG